MQDEEQNSSAPGSSATQWTSRTQGRYENAEWIPHFNFCKISRGRLAISTVSIPTPPASRSLVPPIHHIKNPPRKCKKWNSAVLSLRPIQKSSPPSSINSSENDGETKSCYENATTDSKGGSCATGRSTCCHSSRCRRRGFGGSRSSRGGHTAHRGHRA